MGRSWSAGCCVLLAGLAPACALFTTLDGLSGQDGATDAGATESAAPAPTTSSTSGGDGGPAERTPDAGLPDGGAPGAAYRAAVLADGPKGYFGLEELQGNGCVNLGASADVTCIYPTSGVTRGAPGIAGTKGLHFDSVASRLSLNGSPTALAQPYTIELWFVEEAIVKATHVLSLENVGAPRNGIVVFVDDDLALHAEAWSSNTLLSYAVTATPLVAKVWHHVALVHATGPDEDRMFVDGAPVEGMNLAAGSRPTITSPLSFGDFVGSIDEVAVYDRALTPARIAAHFAAQ